MNIYHISLDFISLENNEVKEMLCDIFYKLF